MLLPVARGLVIARQTLLGRAFEHCGIQPIRIQPEHIHQIFPRPVDGFLLEIVAERPVAEHLEHRVVICVHSHLFEIVVFSTDAQALLRVGHPAALWGCIAEDYILELIHARIRKHQRRIILDDHGRRGHYLMAFLTEKLFERFSYLFGSKLLFHLLYLCFRLAFFFHV